MRKFVLIPQHVYSSSFETKQNTQSTMSQKNDHNIGAYHINSDDNAMVDGVSMSDASEPWATTTSKGATTSPTKPERDIAAARNHIGNGRNDNNIKDVENVNTLDTISTQVVDSERVVDDDDPLETIRSLIKQRVLLQRQRKATLALLRFYVANKRLIIQGNTVRLEKNLFVPYYTFVELLRYAAASRKSSKQPKHAVLFLQTLREIAGMNMLLAPHLRVKPVRKTNKRKAIDDGEEEDNKRKKRMKRLCKKSALRRGVPPPLLLPY